MQLLNVCDNLKKSITEIEQMTCDEFELWVVYYGLKDG